MGNLLCSVYLARSLGAEILPCLHVAEAVLLVPERWMPGSDFQDACPGSAT